MSRAQQAYPGKCEYCGRPYVAKGPRAKFCAKCRKNRYKKPEPEKGHETMKTVASQRTGSVQ